MSALFQTWFHQFLSADPVCYLRLSPACQPASRRDDKAIISPIQQLSHAAAEQVTINFLPWQCRHCTLNRDYISLSIFIWKCISRKRPCARSCAHDPFDSLQRGPGAVSRRVSGKLWIVTNCSRWQLNADDGERVLHHIAYTFECVCLSLCCHTLSKYPDKDWVRSRLDVFGLHHSL